MRRSMMRCVVLAAVVMGPACGDSSPRTRGGATDSATDSVTTVGIGTALPVYRATSLTGAPVTLGGTGGPLTLVNVWATWCTSCKEEMQDLAAIHRDYTSRGLRVVAVSVDAGSEALVRRFVQHESLPFPVVHDQAGLIQRQYHIVGVPTSYLIGTDGRVRWQQVGGIHGNLPAVRVELSKALGG